MAIFSRGLQRTAIISCFLFTLVTISIFYDTRAAEYAVRHPAWSAQRELSTITSYATTSANPLFQRPDLDEVTCGTTFPGLFVEIDGAVARGPFHFSPSPVDYQGLVQASIKNGKLYILTTAPDTLPQILHQRTAVLSQIHRALITSPSPLPNTTFAFTINDVPKNNTWGFARPNKASDLDVWLMPTFASWSWPNAHLDAMDTTLLHIDALENSTTWDSKTDKAIWRGTPWFNPIGHPHLRKDLLKAAKGKDWADVAPLNASNVLPLEHFCRYKYVVYTEGVTYSGRLPFHQACNSVLLTAPLDWLTTSALLLRPIDADVLMGRGGAKTSPGSVMAYADANAIYVAHDFSNLEAVVGFLRRNPHVGRRVARNQREWVVGGGYLGLAAETCYWRALVRGWARVVHVDEGEWGTGERFEGWLLGEVGRGRAGARGRVGR
ncbi:hypothetical protein CC86DRAFT_417592 [Ophiobolus disseminans]|uniref:Glycosyl transferase CAP10 domain-containing protein n=1 Tax=Ophiobolus disseminans TaxID=1469910 RepID=A0A6A6ZZM0_9PLEO|nr:hypothetical protein CC86DRAFT_417592 [Ophiobolus disseminans]